MKTTKHVFWVNKRCALEMQKLEVLILITLMTYEYTSALELYCGPERYDRETEICCGLKIHQKIQNSKEMACCTRSGKEELYPMYEKICCGEQLVPVPRGHRLKCCNGELIDRTESTQWDCCGNSDFGVKYSFPKMCCVDTEKKEFGVYEYTEYSECCSSLKYNMEEEVCSHNGSTYSVEKISSMKPCGNSQYDSDIYLCCEQTGKVIPRPKEHQRGLLPPVWMCWNDIAYDSNKYYFDARTSRVIIQGLVLCGNETYSRNDKYMKCCGTALFRVQPGMNVTCCGDSLRDLNDASVTCCGGKFIPTATLGCCDNVPFKKGYDQQCCGRTLIDKGSDICCRTQSSYTTVTPKLHASHTNCCKSLETGRIKTYNKYTEVCDRGEIRERRPHDTFTRSTALKETTSETSTDRTKCPFCSPMIDKTVCSKTRVFRFFVYDKRKTKHGTILNGIILEPLEKNGKEVNGQKIKIRTRTQCGCFKTKKNFYLFTNRKIKNIKENRYNIRFTAEDVFIPEDDIESLSKCLTYQGAFAGNSKKNGL